MLTVSYTVPTNKERKIINLLIRDVYTVACRPMSYVCQKYLRGKRAICEKTGRKKKKQKEL
jgi:hypothetical protein